MHWVSDAGPASRRARQSPRDAGVISGLNVLRIITCPLPRPSPTAWTSRPGRTSWSPPDVSLPTFDKGVFEAVATNGDTHSGGKDFDQRVVQRLCSPVALKVSSPDIPPLNLDKGVFEAAVTNDDTHSRGERFDQRVVPPLGGHVSPRGMLARSTTSTCCVPSRAHCRSHL